jgi:hypothetical protein
LFNGSTGNTIIGSHTDSGLAKLQVVGSASISSTLAVTGVATFSNSVGINGATPLAPLHVKGNSSSSYNGFFVTTNTYNASVDGSILRFGHVASSGDTVGIIDNLTTGGSGVGVISIIPNLGRVLIGKITDDGSTKLQVSGSASITSTLAVIGATTLSSSVTIGNKTTTEINALTPATGMVAFNTTLGTLCFYDGATWKKVSHSAM